MVGSMSNAEKSDCPHHRTINGVAGGPDRVVCEDCGSVTARNELMTLRTIDRSMFSRDADQPLDAGA